MTIDNHKILPGSARLYPAIGGGWAIKMNIRGGGELLFGCYSDRDKAEAIVARANRLNHNTTVEALERGEREKPMGKTMIEVRVMLTAEEARAIDNELTRLSRCIDELPKNFEGNRGDDRFRFARDITTRHAFEKLSRAIGGQRPVNQPKLKLTSAA